MVSVIHKIWQRDGAEKHFKHIPVQLELLAYFLVQSLALGIEQYHLQNMSHQA